MKTEGRGRGEDRELVLRGHPWYPLDDLSPLLPLQRGTISHHPHPLRHKSNESLQAVQGYQTQTHLSSLATSPGAGYYPSVFALCSDHNLPHERENGKNNAFFKRHDSLTQAPSHYHRLSS